MRFITFIKSLPQQQDKNVNSFIKWVKQAQKFPLYSQPETLGIFLSDKLTLEQTLGYQLCMILYRHEPKNELSKDLSDEKNFRDALNVIIAFQQQEKSTYNS